jgi:hypothetical protein
MRLGVVVPPNVTAKVAFKQYRRNNRDVYRCEHCFLWHVGTPEPKIKKFIKRQKLVRLVVEPEWRFE